MTDPSAVAQGFWFASIAGEILLSITLIAKRQYLAFPIFLLWITFTALSEWPLFWASGHSTELNYERAYVIGTLLDYVFQLGILLEIANAVLRPSRRPYNFAMLGGFLAAGVVVFALVATWVFRHDMQNGFFSSTGHKLQQASFAFSYLRLIVFAAIAGFSQMLGITWKSHVIRLAGGLAFYSAVSVVVQLTISHLSQANRNSYLVDYFALTRTQSCAYLISLAFWVWSFVQKDAPRREFTPQMERFLVTMSETARRSRLGFTRSMGHK